MSSKIQPSFSGGEVSPRLESRVDLAKYFSSLKTLKNMIVFPQGGVTRRPGFKYIGQTKVQLEIDYMEYANDAAAQAAYVTSDASGASYSADLCTDGAKAISDSENAANTDDKAIDDNGATSWQTFRVTGTQSGVSYIGYDFGLGNSAHIREMTITQHSAGAGINSVKVQYSDDDALAVWTTHSTRTITKDGVINTIELAASAAHRAWRFLANGETGNIKWAVTEMQMMTLSGNVHLQCYSEATIKYQGLYSLRIFALATESLNDTLTRTVSPTLNLSGVNTVAIRARASRTGSNFKIGIHDSGGATTEDTIPITIADTWYYLPADISAVADANKDAIDSIIITIVNADADNMIYIDWLSKEDCGNIAKSRLIPFEFSTVQAYILEFGDEYIRFYKDGGVIPSGANPYEISSPWLGDDLAALKFIQSADVLYITHPDYAPRKLSRTGHTAWLLSTINFNPPPTAVQPYFPDTTLTPGAVTGTGITFTAGAAVFQNGDPQRQIIYGAAKAIIITYTDTTHVVCDIIDDFPSTDAITSGSWAMHGSPTGYLMPDKQKPKGALVTLTSMATETRLSIRNTSYKWTFVANWQYYLEAAAGGDPGLSHPDKVYEAKAGMVVMSYGNVDAPSYWHWGNPGAFNTIYVTIEGGKDPDTKATNFLQAAYTDTIKNIFRSSDVGKYVRINNGLVKIVGYTSATEVTGEIIKEMSSLDRSSSFTLESVVWSDGNGYPSCLTFFENRLFFAGSAEYPMTIWGSKPNDFENFTLGADDDDGVSYSFSPNEINIIRWLEAGKVLLCGTNGGEWRVGATSMNDPITPTNVSVKRETNYGSADVQPVTIGQAVLFLQRMARKLREIVYNWDVDGYLSNDLTILAEHITKGGIIDMAYQREPNGILWGVRDDGVLLGFTYLKEHEVFAWHRHVTDGEFENVAVIPSTDVEEFELWAVVKRTLAGGIVRCIERMNPMFSDDDNLEDAFFVDCSLTYDGDPAATITGLGHLEGEEVDVLADGIPVTGKTVLGGLIVLDSAASKVHVGLHEPSDIETLRLEVPIQGASFQGKTKRIIRVTPRVYRTYTFKMGQDENNLDVITPITGEIYTGDIEDLSFDARHDRDGYVFIRQDEPLPLTLLALIPEFE